MWNSTLVTHLFCIVSLLLPGGKNKHGKNKHITPSKEPQQIVMRKDWDVHDLRRGEREMSECGPSFGEVYAISDNDGLGDLFAITVTDASGTLVTEIDTWETEVLHEGVTMAAGSPLEGSHGFGKIRATSELRRAAMIFGSAMEFGEPIAYAWHYLMEPYEELGANR